MGQKTRDTGYAAMPMNFERTKEATERQERERDYKLVAILKREPLAQTEPRLEAELREADNVMAAEARPTGQHYRHYDQSTGEWERRWMASPQPAGAGAYSPRLRSPARRQRCHPSTKQLFNRHMLTWRNYTTRG
jgi:hypothetical protein